MDNIIITNLSLREDGAVEALGNEIIKVNLYAQQLIVAGDEDVVRATNDLSLMSKLGKALEEKRKEYLVPLQEQVKSINSFFKLLTEPLELADKTTRGKLLAYRQVIEAKRQEEERINNLRLEAARAEMELKGELSEDINLVALTPPEPKKVQTDVGTLSTVKIRKWEVADFAAVSDEYKLIDAGKVTKLVKAGIGAIAGIRIWEEETLRVNAK